MNKEELELTEIVMTEVIEDFELHNSESNRRRANILRKALIFIQERSK